MMMRIGNSLLRQSLPFYISSATLVPLSPFRSSFPFTITVGNINRGGGAVTAASPNSGSSSSRLFCYNINNNYDYTHRGGEDADGGSEQEQDQEEDSKVKAKEEEEEWVSAPSSASPYQILGVDPTTPTSASQLKAAFRARVKEFHPDVCKDITNAEEVIQYVIRAYEILSKRHHPEYTTGECLDPFEEPECEASDLFVNEVLCMGKGCPYSCVRRVPYAFVFTTEYGTARATSQGLSGDYEVQLAVGQCPKRCIHYVTPSQRTLLEDLLHSVLNNPYDMGEAALLESLIMKATVENNRYQKPKRQPKVSTEYVDWC